MEKEKLSAVAEMVKSLVRPFIIIWGFIIYGVCVLKKAEVPDILAFLLSAVIIEYFGERAIIRLKENSKEDGQS